MFTISNFRLETMRNAKRRPFFGVALFFEEAKLSFAKYAVNYSIMARKFAKSTLKLPGFGFGLGFGGFGFGLITGGFGFGGGFFCAEAVTENPTTMIAMKNNCLTNFLINLRFFPF